MFRWRFGKKELLAREIVADADAVGVTTVLLKIWSSGNLTTCICFIVIFIVEVLVRCDPARIALTVYWAYNYN